MPRLALAVGYTDKTAAPVVLYCGPSLSDAKAAAESPAAEFAFTLCARIDGAKKFRNPAFTPAPETTTEAVAPPPVEPAPEAPADPDPPAEEPEGLARVVKGKK